MGDTRIAELRGKLAEHDWKVVGESGSNGGRPSVWQVQRKSECGPFHLEFESIEGEEPAEIEQAFGVRIRELKQTSIYLYRKRTDQAWARVIDELLAALDELEA